MKLLGTVVNYVILFIGSILANHCIADNNGFGHQLKQRILVLNSYNQGYRWTDNIVRAIGDKFGENPNIIINIEYMDTKMINNMDHFEWLKHLYKNKYEKYTIDVIISSDDDALKFLRKYQEELFPGVPIVFCGVNNFSNRKVRDLDNYTGVNEKSGFKDNIELFLTLHPNTKKLYVINDNLTTAIALQAEFFEAFKEYENQLDVEVLSDISIRALVNKVSSLEEDSIIYYLSFFSDSTGRTFTPNEVIPYVSKASPVPVYGSVDYMLGHGIIGGAFVSGYFQGKSAANAAEKILQGVHTEKIPVIMDNPSKHMFDYQQLKRFNIDVSKLPKDSTIINQP